MKSIWIANYGENKIRVENNWFSGEFLYVNDVLQDKQQSLFSANLSGHIVNKNQVKEQIKVRIHGSFHTKCYLFVNDELIDTKQIM